MAASALGAFGLLYIPWLAALSLAYECVAWPVGAIGWLIARRTSAGDLFRVHNWFYGRLIVAGLWPLVRVRREGVGHVPRSGSCVFVLNHRSFLDIYLCGLMPRANDVFVVRSWPFRIPLVGWFMRRAGYVNIERTSAQTLIGPRAERWVRRGIVTLFFPEGHRSPDGRLRRFHPGAFALAARYGLPVVPVCLSGSERVFNRRWPWLRPARIHMTFLPVVEPSAFPDTLELRRAVEARMRACLEGMDENDKPQH